MQHRVLYQPSGRYVVRGTIKNIVSGIGIFAADINPRAGGGPACLSCYLYFDAAGALGGDCGGRSDCLCRARRQDGARNAGGVGIANACPANRVASEYDQFAQNSKSCRSLWQRFDFYPNRKTSFRGASFGTGIGNARDHPPSVDMNQVEQVCSAVIDLPIDQKVERSPHHGEIVIDPDQWIVNAFLNLCLPGFPYALRKGFKGHLRGLAIAHQNHRAARQRGCLDRHSISL